MKEKKIVSSNQMKKQDVQTLQDKNLTTFELLLDAGTKIAEIIKTNIITKDKKILIISGHGNNGGDALVCANDLSMSEYSVEVFTIGNQTNASNENLHAQELLKNNNIKTININQKEDLDLLDQALIRNDIVIDGIFGNGIKRPIKGIYYNVIQLINFRKKFVISIDLPSGINSDNGLVENVAIKANHTIVIQNYKYGNLLSDAFDYSGHISLLDIGITEINETHDTHYLEQSILSNIHKRKLNTHKYNYGNILVIGGYYGMMGAPLLAARAAMRSGSGLVHLRYHDELLNLINNTDLEIMLDTYNTPAVLSKDFERKSAIIFGPGLGKNSKRNYDILERLLKTDIRLLIDADGLFYLKDLLDKYADRGNIVITPHAKEMSSLLDVSTLEFLRDPVDFLKDFTSKYNITVVYKSVSTLIINKDVSYISPISNPGLATAGTGDVLSGIIGSFLGRDYQLIEACKIGVIIHSLAALEAKKSKGVESMIATDVIDNIYKILK